MEGGASTDCCVPANVTTLSELIVNLDDRLTRAEIPHAFGGALALAWCTERVRATMDVDVNVFLPATSVAKVLRALPGDLDDVPSFKAAVAKDGQGRVWSDGIPVDVFFSTHDFHAVVETRIRRERFHGREIPFLSCHDLAIFKAFFHRPQDWVDLEAMATAKSVRPLDVAQELAAIVGDSDERVSRLRALKG